MPYSRRRFLGTAAASSALLAGYTPFTALPAADLGAIMAAAAQPVLRQDLLPSAPVVIEQVDLLRNGRQYMVRVRAEGGAEGLAVVHGGVLEQAYPIFLGRVAPVAVGKDARAWEETLDDIYLGRGGFGSSYKWQGLPFWVSVASLEMAVLDLLGRAAGRNVTDLLWGGRLRDEVAVYRASSNRGNAPEEEVEWFQKQVEEIGAEAIKFRLGARMHYTDASTARDEALIPLMREAFPDLTLYADANGSFDVEMGVRIGRMMEAYDYGFFEEPAPFDYYAETRAVTEQLQMPVAGGEQESSLRQFLAMIDEKTVDIVQPDLFYFGGLVRSIRVGRAAEAAGLECTPHISGYGLGFLYAAIFAAVAPNAGAYHEYKGIDEDLPATAEGGRLEARNGVIRVPTGPGLGAEIDPAFVAAADVIGA